MDQVVRSLSREELARYEAQTASSAAKLATAAAKVTFVGGMEGREIVVPLAYPVNIDGTPVATVKVRRPVMREWRAYLRACADAVRMHGPGADDKVDQEWLSIPAAVLEELDAIDAIRLENTMESFFELPGSTQDPGLETSTPTTGDASAST